MWRKFPFSLFLTSILPPTSSIERNVCVENNENLIIVRNKAAQVIIIILCQCVNKEGESASSF
jgi:hypothetical protein